MRFRNLLFLCLLFLFPVASTAQVTPVYEGYYDVQTNGNDTSYMSNLTHRYVGSELRFLTLTHRYELHEIRKPSAFGARADTTTQQWNLAGTGAMNNHNGIWFEQAKNRLWITSAEDYTNVNHPAKVTLVALGANGSVSVLKQFFLTVPAKRVYGGCNAVPASLVSSIGGPYVCGWGGYTSLVAQGGGASMGPTMYAIPDPDTIANGATVNARTILDASGENRGVRVSIPLNYFDGGDADANGVRRENPNSRPTLQPYAGAGWLSPNSAGLGWFVWGDSYYNTGMWVGTTFVSVASLCQGACWYQGSTLNFDGRQYEWHQWNGSTLGGNILKRPDSMSALTPPRGNNIVWGGNTPGSNIAGATYDATTGKIYLIGYPLGPDVYTGRLFQYRVGAATPVDPPIVNANAVLTPFAKVSETAWSACVSGAQTKVETWARTVITPATGTGTTGALSEDRTVSQPCSIVEPPTTEVVTHADLKTILDRIEAAMSTPDVVTFNVVITSVGSNYANGDRRLTIRVPSASMPVSPANGSTLRIVR